MKTKLLAAIVLLALVGAFAVPVRAEEPANEKPVSKRDMAKYDTDHDGVLSPEEKAVMVAAKEEAKAKRAAKKAAKKEAEAAAAAAAAADDDADDGDEPAKEPEKPKQR